MDVYLKIQLDKAIHNFLLYNFAWVVIFYTLYKLHWFITINLVPIPLSTLRSISLTAKIRYRSWFQSRSWKSYCRVQQLNSNSAVTSGFSILCTQTSKYHWPFSQLQETAVFLRISKYQWNLSTVREKKAVVAFVLKTWVKLDLVKLRMFTVTERNYWWVVVRKNQQAWLKFLWLYMLKYYGKWETCCSELIEINAYFLLQM